jgi:DamX protein
METAAEMPSVAKVLTGSGAKVFTLDESGVSTKPPVAVESPLPAKGETGKDTAPVVRLAGNVTPAVSGTVKSQTAHDLDWLRKQDRSHYVIQLVGTRDAAAAGKFLDDHELGSNGAWFVTSHESKPWYVVVYGIYPSNASARVAIEALPQALRAGSPWPRSVASVVDSVR